VLCTAEEKELYLYYFLQRFPGRTLVFVNSISTTRRLLETLRLLQIPVNALHAQMQQRQRLTNFDRFKASAASVLIATDVAARGLDVPEVDHVVHFHLPVRKKNDFNNPGSLPPPFPFPFSAYI